MSTSFHISNCPVCGSDQFELVFETQDWLATQESFKIMDCSACSFRFTQDAPIQEEVGKYYDDEGYVEHSDTKKGLVFTLYHYGRLFMLRNKYRMIKKLGTGKRLLDIGSASGYFMNHMKERGFQVKGVEISEKARALCKSKFNIDSYTPEMLLEGSLDGQFDLITMWHVFEHVYTYNEYFEAFKKLLSPNGVLIIAMPNYKSVDAQHYKKYWNAYDVPRHLWHFDYDSFQRFASDRGFQFKKVKSLPLDPVYNAMVSAEFKKSSLPGGILLGKWAWLKGIINKKKASSLVYLLQKD